MGQYMCVHLILYRESSQRKTSAIRHCTASTSRRSEIRITTIDHCGDFPGCYQQHCALKTYSAAPAFEQSPGFRKREAIVLSTACCHMLCQSRPNQDTSSQSGYGSIRLCMIASGSARRGTVATWYISFLLVYILLFFSLFLPCFWGTVFLGGKSNCLCLCCQDFFHAAVFQVLILCNGFRIISCFVFLL